MNEFINKLIALRHYFHQNPELGFKEINTKAKIANFLHNIGLEVHEGVGVVGVLRARAGGRVIGLRADMDALPIQERSTHDYPSKNNGIMHACGHDGHMAMLLGAAEELAQDLNFDGTVVFIFQPNEEHGLGAQAMINEGILDRYSIEEIYAIHNLPGAPMGQVSTCVGQICASESLFEIELFGQGGHASMPHVGVDTITVGAEMVMALQTIIARKIPPSAGAVLSVTEFKTDGQRNVLPGYTMLKGDVRTALPQDRKVIENFMQQIVQGVAQTHGIRASMTFRTEFIETINAKDPTEAVIDTAIKQGLEIIPNCPPMSFSEDFAHFCAAVPGCFILLGNGETDRYGQPLHSDDYDFNDDLLPVGVALWKNLVQNRLPCS